MNSPHSSISAPEEELLEYFFCSLRRSRLLAEDQVDELKKGELGNDLDALSDWLIREGWLTPYQFKRILEGEPQGLVLGPYAVRDELGHGGFGRVYKAFHTLMKRAVALKVIAPTWMKDSEARDLFLREIAGVTQLEHPHIALAYDADLEDDILYLAMEYVDGPTLAHYVEAHGPLPIPFTSEIVLQVALALVYTHEKGVVHRDIKPANILLSGGDRESEPETGPSAKAPFTVKVIDFGLARLYPRGAASPCTLMRGDHLVGTPEFMAPEQAWDFHQVDIRSDLYSLGGTFYFALTGRYPLRGRTQLETIMKQLEQEPEPISGVRPGIPPVVASIVHRLMAKDPEKRFQTPAELVLSLSGALREIHWQRAAPPPSPPQPPPLTPDDSEGIRPSGRSDAIGRDADASAQNNEPAGPSTPVPEDCRSGKPTPPQEDRVRPLWDRWQVVLAGIAHESALPWTEGEYRSLHGGLLKVIRAQIDASSPRARLYARLESFVEPWLTFRSLAKLDRQTQVRLWSECRALDAELPPPRRRFDPRSLAFWLLSGLALAGGLYVLKFLFPLSL